ncbi:MAG: radical SAM family heme chaperone HemW [Phycisphaerales bacterium JB043]
MGQVQRIGVTTGGQRPSSSEAIGSTECEAESLYVHIPFCSHKCHYCDFYSIVSDSRTYGRFTDALCRELESQSSRAGRLRTIFVGGGTPTLLPASSWERVLDTIHACYDLSELEEFTVESNPDTSDESLLRLLRGGGVSRVSIGAQSFESDLLRFLERSHEPSNVERALEACERVGIERRNVDLIFAIPGQTITMWRRDLERVLGLTPGIDHVSCYALTYEEGTPLTQRVRRGECAIVGEDAEMAMLDASIDMLDGAGFERYEVSNFARRGSECAHNLGYWRCESCLAVGPSASGHLRDGSSGWRWTNVRSLRDWMASVEETGFSEAAVLEPPDASRSLRERLMLGMRVGEGIAREAVLDEARTIGCERRVLGAIEIATDRGLIENETVRVRPTAEGLRVADSLGAMLMEAVTG